MAVISSLLIRLGVNERDVERGFKNARKSVDDFQRKINQSSAALKRIGGAMTSVGVGPGIVAATGAVTSLAAVAAPAVNTVLALPSALAQLGAAGAAVKLGMSGVGDAIGAVADGAADANERLAALSPSARSVAGSVGRSISTLRKATQEPLFAPWAKEFDVFAKQQTPMLANGLGRVASSLGGVARAAVVTASGPLVTGVIGRTFDSTVLSTNALANATPGLTKGLFALIDAANPLTTSFLESAFAAAGAKGEWLASAEGMAWLRDKLAEGKVTMGQLIAIVQNLGATLMSIFGGTRVSAGDLLGKIEELTAKWREWAASAEGQEKIIAFMDRAKELGSQMGEALGRVVDVALKLVDAFNKLPEPVQSAALTFSAYALILGPLVSRFSSLIGVLFQVSAALYKGGAAAIAFMSKHVFSSKGVVGGWVLARVQLAVIWLQLQAMAAASAIGTAASWAATRVQVAAIWLSLQVQAAATAARTAAAWAASWIAQKAAALASMAATVATVVAGWVMMGVQSMIQAARMAAAWLIAMGPVGIIIAVIIALVALIIANWDTIVEWTKKAWNWVYTKGIKPAIDLVVGLVQWWVGKVMGQIEFFASLPGKVWGYWQMMYSKVLEVANNLIGWLTGLPGKIWGAIGDLGSRAAQIGKDLIQGIINGLGQAVGNLVAKARDVASQAMNAIKGALGIGSPSKITYKYAIWVGQGFTNGLGTAESSVVKASTALADAAVRPWDALGSTRPFGADDMARPFAVRTQPARDGSEFDPSDPRFRPGGGDAPLVAIGTFVAGSQTPREVASELDWIARSR